MKQPFPLYTVKQKYREKESFFKYKSKPNTCIKKSWTASKLDFTLFFLFKNKQITHFADTAKHDRGVKMVIQKYCSKLYIAHSCSVPEVVLGDKSLLFSLFASSVSSMPVSVVSQWPEPSLT